VETYRTDMSSDDDRGAIMVEFALILPILLILLVGIVNFGAAYNTQIALQGAAREGARARALGDSAVDAAQNSVGVDGVTVDPGPVCPDVVDPNKPWPNATVTTSKDFTFGIPFFPVGTIPLSATASMRCGL
jgi:hypothetical protein